MNKKPAKIKVVALLFIIFTIFTSCSDATSTLDTATNTDTNINTDINTNTNTSTNTDNNLALNPSTDTQAINQYNNSLLGGFVLSLGDSLYFADNSGIYKTDIYLENITLFVSNDDYPKAVSNSGTVFAHLQYYDEKIYFLNRLEKSIYSMNLDGTNLVKVIDGVELGKESVSDFIVTNDVIYFNYWEEGSRVKSFNLKTNVFIDYQMNHTPLLSLSPKGDFIQFSHELTILNRLSLKDGAITKAMPSNFDELHKNGHLFGILYTANSYDKLIFAGVNRLFSMGEDGYAEEIYHINANIESYINSINDWV